MEDGFHNKKTLEMKVREEIIKTVGNNLQMNQEKMKSMDYSSLNKKKLNKNSHYELTFDSGMSTVKFLVLGMLK